MYEAGKVGLRSPRPQVVPPTRDQLEAALAADFRFSPVAQVTLDRNGCIRRINVAAAVLLKGEPAQLTDIPFIAFVDKAHCRIFLDHVGEATRATKKVCTQLTLAGTTRAISPVELQSTAGIDTITGRAFCRTAIIAVATARSTAPNGLTNHASRYQDWFELFPDAAILEIGGRIISANASALRLLGAESAEQIEGREILEVTHPDSYPSLRDRLSRLPEGKSESTGIEEKFIRLDGREIIVNIVLKSVDFGGVYATLVAARDVTKERQTEQSLVVAKDLSAQILANNSIATAILSAETGRFSEANEIFCRLVARPEKQVIGESLSVIQLVGPGGSEGEFQSADSLIDRREYEARLTRPDGSVLEVLVSAKPVLSGQERSLLLMIQDLTDLRRLRKDVIAISEEEQRRFSRDLHDSHCQDLTAIAFFAETIAAGLAARDEDAAKQIRMLVDMVQKSVENVHALAAGLDSQQIQESGLGVALKDLASRVGRRFGLACTAKVDRKIDYRISAQAVHLYRIAQEAVSNAARHSQARGLTLELQRDGDSGVLRVKDDGVGFFIEKKPNGLGLRTMQYRASVIKGTLKIDSKPGSGTVVICSFPLSDERERGEGLLVKSDR
ncbi:MAG: PAS domain S-box protein [Verrucomicrobia bacterium]|nr:PAS domain S-box protein [Verrucomicrobiota bacterium]